MRGVGFEGLDELADLFVALAVELCDCVVFFAQRLEAGVEGIRDLEVAGGGVVGVSLFVVEGGFHLGDVLDEAVGFFGHVLLLAVMGG